MRMVLLMELQWVQRRWYVQFPCASPIISQTPQALYWAFKTPFDGLSGPEPVCNLL